MYFATCFDVLKDKFVSLNASLFVLVLLSASLVVMANTRVEQQSGRLGRTKWTVQMNCDLLDYKKKALVVTKAPVTLHRIAFHTGLPQPNPIRNI